MLEAPYIREAAINGFGEPETIGECWNCDKGICRGSKHWKDSKRIFCSLDCALEYFDLEEVEDDEEWED